MTTSGTNTAHPSREPAIWVAVAASALQLAVALGLALTGEQQAVLNAAVVAIAGFVTAVWVRRDGQVAAGLGVAQAAIAVGLGFGLKLSPEGQAAAMALLTALAAAFVRTQATAPVSAEGTPQG